MKNPTHFLKKAARVASKIPLDAKQEYRLAAIGIRADGVEVVSTNKSSRPRTPRGKLPCRLRSSHAEIRLSHKLTPGSTIFVVRVNRSGEWAMAKPCPACQQHLIWKGIDRIYFTVSPDVYCLL